MSETSAPEPTMEEILASIRRIISEDEPAAEAAPEAPAPAALHVVEPEPEPAEEPDLDDVLELTQPVAEPAPEPAVETHGDIEVSPAPAPVRAPEPEPAPVARAAYVDEPLVRDDVSSAAASAFGRLSKHVAMPADGMMLEDVVRELLKPLLKAWLDEHLRAIVEAKVEEEVERVRRRQVG
jgi:cell pole-organizing protein PopZ